VVINRIVVKIINEANRLSVFCILMFLSKV